MISPIGFHVNSESRTSGTPGFGIERRTRSYENYRGKPVRLRTSHGDRYGIFKGIEGDDMILQPSVVVETLGIEPGREELEARIEAEVPSSILAYSVAQIDAISGDFMNRYVNSINSTSNRRRLGIIV